MKRIDHIYQTMYSELSQRALDGSFSADFPVQGRFVPVTVKERRYWYFDHPDGARRYVGPAEDIELNLRVANFNEIKDDQRSRRRMVASLIRDAYLPRPDPFAGDIVQALADAGFFRLRGVLVGTVAFQCYAAILGVRLSNASMQTADADFAQFHSISVAVNDSIPSILEVLRSVDPSFRPVPHQTNSLQSTQFISKSKYKVEFLTPNPSSADYDGKPATMPALGGSAAEPLRFLDYLIYEPVRATILHAAGVPVLVPSPQRYAMHKLILATRRRDDDDGTAKSRKDLLQATTLAMALVEQRQTFELADAYIEAFDRGPHWKDSLSRGLAMMIDTEAGIIVAGLRKGVIQCGKTPRDYGLEEPEDSLKDKEEDTSFSL